MTDPRDPPDPQDPLHPPHDPVPARPVPVTVLAEWSPGTFLENLAGSPTGSWWVTSPNHQQVDEVAPDGSVRTVARFDDPVTGIVPDGAGGDGGDAGALVASGPMGKPGWALHRIAGTMSTPVCDLDGVLFANGLVRRGDELLVADSARGLVVAVDPRSGRTAVVLQHALLTAPDPTGPLPGINGLALAPDGDVLLTNSSRGLVLAWNAAGGLEVVAERLVGDDLAVAADGTAYIATHTYHSVLRLDPDGTRTDIATHAEGVAGPTSVALAADGTSLVACTTGGLLSPPDGTVEPARLLRLDLTGEAVRR